MHEAPHPAADVRPLVLLTGFGPFPGVPKNVSGELAAAVAQTAAGLFPAFRFKHIVLPTEWIAAPAEVAAILATDRPHTVLHFGVAADAAGFRIETQGLNVCRFAEDAAGEWPLATTLAPDGRPAHAATLPIRRIASHLHERGYPVSISDDAGAYLCNAVLYRALAEMHASSDRCQIGFIHIPADLSGPPLPFAVAVSGAIEIVRCALAPDEDEVG